MLLKAMKISIKVAFKLINIQICHELELVENEYLGITLQYSLIFAPLINVKCI